MLPNHSTNSRTSNLCVSFPVRTASSFPERTFAPTATSTCMTEPPGASTRRASLTSSGMPVQRRRRSQPELPRGSPAGFSVNSACSRIAACQAAWPIRPDHRAEALNRFPLWHAPHLNLGRPGAFALDGRRHPRREHHGQIPDLLPKRSDGRARRRMADRGARLARCDRRGEGRRRLRVRRWHRRKRSAGTCLRGRYRRRGWISVGTAARRRLHRVRTSFARGSRRVGSAYRQGLPLQPGAPRLPIRSAVLSCVFATTHTSSDGASQAQGEKR